MTIEENDPFAPPLKTDEPAPTEAEPEAAPPKKRKASHEVLDPGRVRSAMLAMQREPFMGLLENMIHASPTVEEIQKWARLNPDRWATAVMTFARLYGYDLKGTVQHEHRHLHLHTMSDSELEAELDKARRETAEAFGLGEDGAVDAEFMQVDPQGGEEEEEDDED